MGRAVGFVAGVVALGVVGIALRTVPAVLADDTRAVPVEVGSSAPATPRSVPTATPSPTTPASTPSPTAQASASATPKTAPTKRAPRPVKVPAGGPGTYTGGTVTVRPATTTGRLVRYDVRVEKGLKLDPDEAGKLMEKVLNDSRSWRGAGDVRFELVPVGEPIQLHAYLATPKTTDALCAPLLTRGDVSCQNGMRVVFNAQRWVKGADAYGSYVTDYRRYLVNHEFGHSLGYQHVGCPGKGKPAPVMMQQTKGLGGCRQNPWPSPKK
jgi:hypothetical protein